MIVDPKVKRNIKKGVAPSFSTCQRRVTKQGSKEKSPATVDPKKGTINITKPMKGKFPQKRKPVTKGTQQGQKK